MPAEWPTRGDRRAGRLAGVVAVALLLGLAAWTVLALQPPPPAPRDAAADRFSATRAGDHLTRIAARPHVAGSGADADVVDYLVATLTGLGLDTRVQNSVGVSPDGPGAAQMAAVRNVVAVLPGTDPTGRLFLMAHHDSVSSGAGASDDGAGVSALLESVRALAQGPRLRNDVVVVVTDAEEACLCGAEAFAASHPLAAHGGVVLNIEAHGTGGPPIRFETSAGNVGLVGVFAAAAPHPVATSFAVEVYRRLLPDFTDFSVLLADGDFTGLNTAFIDGVAAYHTPQDTPTRLDRGTLQAVGENALATARALGDRDLAALSRPAASDATYFPVPGGLVRYPGRLVWPLAAAALVATAGLVVVLRVRGSSSLRWTGAGAVAAVVPLDVAPLAVRGLWWLLVALRPGYAAMTDPWRPGWYRVAAVALVATVVLIWYALLRRRIGAEALAAGALVWFAVLALVLAALAPGGSYLAAWPALAGALAGTAAALAPARGVRLLAALLAGTVAAVVLAPAVALYLPLEGLSSAVAPSVLAALLALALLPALELLFPGTDGAGGHPPRRLAAAAVPAVGAAVAAAGVLGGLAVDRFDADHPVPSQLVYALDADTGRAQWASTEADPGSFTRRYASGSAPVQGDYPYLFGDDVATGPAEAAPLPPPAVTTVADREAGGRREVTVRVTPRRPGVRLLVLDLDAGGGTVVDARAEGRDLPQEALGQHRLWVVFHAPPADGVEATVVVEAKAAARLRVIDGSDGLDGLPGWTPRPAGVDAVGGFSSDLVLVAATVPLG